MNRQLGGKAPGDSNDPLSLLVHAADSQRPSVKGGVKGKPPVERDGGSDVIMSRNSVNRFDDQLAQRQAAYRAEALHHQGLLSQFRGGALGGDVDYFQKQHGGLVAAQHQQAAALALANDFRHAVAAAQLRQAAQFQNHDFLLARTAALQQLGALGATGGGFEHLQQELELQKLEEIERRHILAAAAAAGRGPMAALVARQQELQEAQLRQEQLERQIGGRSAAEAVLAERNAAAIRGQNEASNRTSSIENGNKESFQKTPGSVVVPCRARGMPMDHNFKTAYFVIPENVEHGEELICSYFACRNAGIKFRYCTHCKVPVAKRNFRKRHKHGKLTSAMEGDEDGDADDDEEGSPKIVKKPVKSDPIKIKEEIILCPEIPKTIDVPAGPVSSPKANLVKSSLESGTDGDNEEDSLVVPSQEARPVVCSIREKLWSSLIAKRPPTKDGEAVSAWLMEVLSVSDLDTPLDENGKVSINGSHSETLRENIANSQLEDQATDESDNCSQSSVSDQEPPTAKDSTKKKRPLEAIIKNKNSDVTSSEATSSDALPQAKKDVGSFAEWKDRKKHKVLPKSG